MSALLWAKLRGMLTVPDNEIYVKCSSAHRVWTELASDVDAATPPLA